MKDKKQLEKLRKLKQERRSLKARLEEIQKVFKENKNLWSDLWLYEVYLNLNSLKGFWVTNEQIKKELKKKGYKKSIIPVVISNLYKKGFLKAKQNKKDRRYNFYKIKWN